MFPKGIVFFLLTFLYVAMIAPGALAHKVLLSAYVDGDDVFVESAFSDGTLCKDALIEVLDPSGKKLLEGKTDENGEFSFKPPQRTDLTLVLNAGMGHRAEYTVPAEELPEIAGARETPAEAASPPAAETRKPVTPDDVAGVKAEEVELIVDRVIQNRLRPIAQLIAKSQRKPGVSPVEIFGGIGYILGLMGIATYFRYRKAGNV
jgi:nickel transport protein